MSHTFATRICGLLIVVLAVLFSSASSSQQRIEVPVPVTAATYQEGQFNIHIYERPGSRANPHERSVLILGTFSGPDAVLESRTLVNPETGRPYDVVVGLASDTAGRELGRVLRDHSHAGANAEALKNAFTQHFGGPLVAKSIDTHSNGTTVGVVAVTKGAFQGVKQLHIMGPDIGYGGAYLNKQSLSNLKGAGVESVHVYRNRGDIIPALGEITKEFTKAVPTEKIAEHVYKAVTAMRDLSTASGGGTPMIRYREFQPVGVGTQNHYVRNYVSQRAGFIKEPAAPPPPQDAKGVRIYIDDEILEKALLSGTPEETARLLQAFGQHLATAADDASQERVLARFADQMKARFKNSKMLAKLDEVVVVSLRTVLTQAERFTAQGGSLPSDLRTPGGITRIHGYALDEAAGNVLIFGSRSERGAPIELDDLKVGICAVWKHGETPFVSLDPDPLNPTGPQRVRVHGIPRDSGFALTMLEADYTLKKLLLGAEQVSVPGYTSLKEILIREPVRQLALRFWLYPIQPSAGDIQVSTDGSMVLFYGGAQVLTEEMVHTKEGLVGTGKTYGPAEQAAASATRHYAAIAKQKPIFTRLQGLFDIVLLSKIWQRMGIQSSLLDRLCTSPHLPVNVPESYPAIEVEFHPWVISGGVQATTVAGRRSALAVDDPTTSTLAATARQFSKAGQVAGRFQVPVNVAVPDPVRHDSRELARIAAVRHLRSGRLDEAREAFSKLIEADPYDAQTLVLRALTHFHRNDFTAALSDAQRALELESDDPGIVVLASLITYEVEALEGRMDTAFRALDRALASNPRSIRARVLRAAALARFGRAAEARAELRQAIALDPTAPLAYAHLAALEMRQGWVAQARKWARLAAALAPEAPQVKAILAMAELFGATPERGEQLATEVLGHPAADPSSKLLALMALATPAASRDDWTAVDGLIARARSVAPFSPDIMLAMAVAAHNLKRPAIAARYLDQAERLAPSHPLVKATRQTLGR